MPKVVDNYVFERKIGSGQYGDVYKGYNKSDSSDIAIKAIKRENIKGNYRTTQGSSWNCSRIKSKCSEPATTEASSSCMTSRRLPITFTSSWSTATREIWASTSKKIRPSQKRKPSSSLSKSSVPSRPSSNTKSCIGTSNWPTFSCTTGKSKSQTSALASSSPTRSSHRQC